MQTEFQFSPYIWVPCSIEDWDNSTECFVIEYCVRDAYGWECMSRVVPYNSKDLRNWSWQGIATELKDRHSV